MDFKVVLLRLVVASVLGGLIGIERQSKHRPAGFRTHILVALGAALIMCLSEYLFDYFYVKYGTTGDPARLGAQVISGIGFLGAGTIIHYGGSVKGLTTAASLWAVACVGLAVGAGFYSGAAIVTVIIVITLITLSKVSYRLEEYSNIVDLLVAFDNSSEALGQTILLIGEMGIHISDVEMLSETPNQDGTAVCEFRFVLYFKKYKPIVDVVNQISTIDGVSKVSRI